MKFFLPIIAIFFIISCKNTGGNSAFKNSIKLKCGSVNSIRIINDKLFVLDASNSDLYRIQSDSLYKVTHLSLKGRAFLQDFAMSDSLLFFTNTYDAVYKYNYLSNTNNLDTLFISSPDKIIYFDSSLFITERLEKSNLRIVKVHNDKTIIFPIEQFKKSIITVQNTFIRVFEKSLYIFSNRANKFWKLSLDGSIEEYSINKNVGSGLGGKFCLYKEDDIIKGNILISDNNAVKVAKFHIDNTDNKIIFDNEENISTTSFYDIATSEITKTNIYLYDYINNKIDIFLIKNSNEK